MIEMVELYHFTKQTNINSILNEGLLAESNFDDLGLPIRRGVVYCWLKLEHDKIWSNNLDYTYVKVKVEKSKCRVADMEWSSLSMMYHQGQVKPKNNRAADLLSALYEVTSVPLDEYKEGMFWTPEVLVKGNIAPEFIFLDK